MSTSLSANRQQAGTTSTLASRLVGLVAAWSQRSSQRRLLAGLPEHMLKDIGLSRADVWQETRKPFWQA